MGIVFVVSALDTKLVLNTSRTINLKSNSYMECVSFLSNTTQAHLKNSTNTFIPAFHEIFLEYLQEPCLY